MSRVFLIGRKVRAVKGKGKAVAEIGGIIGAWHGPGMMNVNSAFVARIQAYGREILPTFLLDEFFERVDI